MAQWTIRGVKLELVCGDIAKQPDVEAVVNAANAELRSGGGVAGAILDELSPFMQQAFEVRRTEQGKAVDRLFELRETLTEDEWSTVFEKLK